MGIPYYLGIDVGTTYTAAAVSRSGLVEMAMLGNTTAAIPSVVLLRDDGHVLIGEAAERRAASEPERVAREFKRRVGDSTPVILGGTPYSADALMAKVLRWVVDVVSREEGGPPDRIAVTHPANWDEYKKDLLRQAVKQAALGEIRLLPEPEAAAVHYAAQERVASGQVVAVYDLGGGTFDAAVLRRTGPGWEMLGTPDGVERLGGIDVDQAVLHHVLAVVGDDSVDLDAPDPQTRTALAWLRRECVTAKEALSTDGDVAVPVLLPSRHTEVRLTRRELEEMIRPVLLESTEALRRTIHSAGLKPQDIHAVLLVGGSSRMPLVAALVGAELGRPVAIDAHPKHIVALGAARVAAAESAADSVAVAPTVVSAVVADDTDASTAPDGETDGDRSADPPARRRWSARGPLLATTAAAVVLVVLLVAFVLRPAGGSDGDRDAASGTATTAADGNGDAGETTTVPSPMVGVPDTGTSLPSPDAGSAPSGTTQPPGPGATTAPPVTVAPTPSPSPPPPTTRAMVTVPDLVGLEESTARSHLAALGLTATKTDKLVAHFNKIDKVLSQSPAAGTRVLAGSSVTIEVGYCCEQRP